MPSDLPPALPHDLVEAPELAALEILHAVAGTTTRAILAVHPELQERDFLLEYAAVTPQLCLGAAVLSSIEILTVAVQRYRIHQEMNATAGLHASGSNDF